MSTTTSPPPLRLGRRAYVSQTRATEHEIHADIAAMVRQLRTAVDHIAQLEHTEDPHATGRLIDALTRGADDAHAALDPHVPSIARDELCELHVRVLDLTRHCSRYLVRDGVRRILEPAAFDAIEDSAVLVGELAKVAFGELLMSTRGEALPNGRRRCSFDVNPLHAFTPAIAAGYRWAREHVRVDEGDRHDLIERLITSAAEWHADACNENQMAHPTSVMTADALNAFLPEWMRRSDDELVRELDRTVDRVLPTLDGCGVEPLEIELWVHIGAMSGVLRSLLPGTAHTSDRAHDTCDATALLTLLLDARDADQHRR